jgi:hypothetical protein
LGEIQLSSVGTDVGPLKSHTKWLIPVPPISSPSKLNSIEWNPVVSPSLIGAPLLSGTKALSMVVAGAMVSFTSIETVATLLSTPLVSLTVKVKKSVPVKPVSGV